MQKKGLVLLGTNLGDKAENFDFARRELALHTEIVAVSRIYVSPPWGYESTNDYWNQVVELRFETEPHELLSTLLAIEQRAGRVRNGEGYSDRTLDLDILHIDGVDMNTPELELPHPRMHLRAFTLLPLLELRPSFVLKSGLSAAAQLATLEHYCRPLQD